MKKELELKDTVEDGGGVYVGYLPGDPDGLVSQLVVFNDRRGNTFCLPANQLTEDEVNRLVGGMKPFWKKFKRVFRR